MALESTVASAGESEEENSELRDMTRRLGVGGGLALPVFVLVMAHLVPAFAHIANGTVSRWIQFLLSTPVVWWAGWPGHDTSRRQTVGGLNLHARNGLDDRKPG